MQILTVTNLKGGVGKTSLTLLLARYIARNKLYDPVVVIDLDPQCGSTALLSGRKDFQYTISEALEMENQGIASTDVLQAALVQVQGEQKLWLIPSSHRLSQFGANGAPTDLLSVAIQNVPNVSDDTIFIIDTGTMPQLVAMGITASTLGVIVPMTLSKQTLPPTSNTIGMIIRAHKRLLGIVPSASGNANWETANVEALGEKLKSLPALSQTGAKMYPGLPYSKAIVRGDWFRSEKDVIPAKFVLAIDQIYCDLFGHSAIPASVAIKQTEPAEL